MVNASQRVFGMPEMVIEMCATFLLRGSMSECPPRKKAWISLDSFGRIVTYQWVTANPSKNFLPAVRLAFLVVCKSPDLAVLSYSCCGGTNGSPERHIARILFSRKEIVASPQTSRGVLGRMSKVSCRRDPSSALVRVNRPGGRPPRQSSAR